MLALTGLLLCGLSWRAEHVAAQVNPQLPADFRLSFIGTRNYTSGPHGLHGLCVAEPVAQAAGIDFGFGGQSFVVLSIAQGIYKGRGDREPTGSERQAGRWALIAHADGIQSAYWRLASFSPELDQLDLVREQLKRDGSLNNPEVERQKLTIPQGFPLAGC